MTAAGWSAVVIGLVFLAAMAYTERRDDLSDGIPPLIGAGAILAMDAIGGFELSVYTVALLILFLLAGAFRTWEERRSSSG